MGGDYFDYIELPGNRLGIVLADVSGKGISAALLMAKLASETRFFLNNRPSALDAVLQVNNSFLERSPGDKFVTMVLLVLELHSHRIHLVNAGHMHPLLRRSDGAIEAVGRGASGLPLGLQSDCHIREHELTLQPAECLFIYTDGVTDARSPEGEMYRSSRLREAIARGPNVAGQLGATVVSDVNQFIGRYPRYDDMCLVCISRLRS